MTSIVSDITVIFALASRLRKRFKDGPSQYQKACNTLDELIQIVKEVDRIVAPNDPDEIKDNNCGPFIPNQGPRITELSDSDDGTTNAKVKNGQNDSQPATFDPNGSIGRAMERHISRCRAVLILFEQRAKDWESAIAATPKEGFAFSSFTALVGQARKSIAANISFSEKEMQKCITELKSHIDALSTYLEVGMVQYQQQMQKVLKKIEHGIFRVEKRQDQMLVMLQEVQRTVKGARLISVGSSYGPGEVVPVFGAGGSFSFLPVTFCQTEEDLSYLLNVGLRGSVFSQFFKNSTQTHRLSKRYYHDGQEYDYNNSGLTCKSHAHSPLSDSGDKEVALAVFMRLRYELWEPEVSQFERSSVDSTPNKLLQLNRKYGVELTVFKDTGKSPGVFTIIGSKYYASTEKPSTCRFKISNLFFDRFSSPYEFMDALIDVHRQIEYLNFVPGSKDSEQAKDNSQFINELRSNRYEATINSRLVEILEVGALVFISKLPCTGCGDCQFETGTPDLPFSITTISLYTNDLVPQAQSIIRRNTIGRTGTACNQLN